MQSYLRREVENTTLVGTIAFLIFVSFRNYSSLDIVFIKEEVTNFLTDSIKISNGLVVDRRVIVPHIEFLAIELVVKDLEDYRRVNISIHVEEGTPMRSFDYTEK